MDCTGKNERPYRGMIFPFIAMLLVPVVLFFICYFAIKKTYYNQDEVAIPSSLFFAGLSAVGFGLFCFCKGLFSYFIPKFTERIRETHELFGLFTKDGMKYYFYCFVSDGGPLFYAFVLVELFYIGVCLYGLFNFLDWYNTEYVKTAISISFLSL